MVAGFVPTEDIFIGNIYNIRGLLLLIFLSLCVLTYVKDLPFLSSTRQQQREYLPNTTFSYRDSTPVSG